MTLVQFVDVLFVKQRRVFLAVLIVVLAAAAALTFALPKEYDATATLFVGDNRPVATGANSVPLDQVLAQSYRDLLGTPTTRAGVARRLGVPEGRLGGTASFSIATGTHLIRITGTAHTPTRAAAIANAYARTFVRGRYRAAQSNSRSRLNALQHQMRNLSLKIARLQHSSRQRDVADMLDAQNRLTVARQSYSAIVQNTQLQGQNVSVASLASRPATPSRPRPALYLTLGTVLALMLATAAAFAANAFDDRIREGDEVGEIFDAPIVGWIPRVRNFGFDGQPQLVEAFEFLRMNLALTDGRERSPRVLAVTGAVPGVGKTAITAGLAKTLAGNGASVIAADADLRRPRLGHALGCADGRGMTDAFTTSTAPGDLLQTTEGGVQVLASGSTSTDAGFVFQRAWVEHLVRDLRTRASTVLIDTPPLLSAPEASLLTAVADGVLVVVDLSDSHRRQLHAASEQLAKAGARVVGVVLNSVARHGRESYHFGYYDYPPAPNGSPPGKRRIFASATRQ